MGSHTIGDKIIFHVTEQYLELLSSKDIAEQLKTKYFDKLVISSDFYGDSNQYKQFTKAVCQNVSVNCFDLCIHLIDGKNGLAFTKSFLKRNMIRTLYISFDTNEYLSIFLDQLQLHNPTNLNKLKLITKMYIINEFNQQRLKNVLVHNNYIKRLKIELMCNSCENFINCLLHENNCLNELSLILCTMNNVIIDSIMSGLKYNNHIAKLKVNYMTKESAFVSKIILALGSNETLQYNSFNCISWDERFDVEILTESDIVLLESNFTILELKIPVNDTDKMKINAITERNREIISKKRFARTKAVAS